ncbi:MAG: hypothetical protein NTY19_45275 [Planctomycetota bacterium]|nr:hypothetical protein [Planctomycetota bacterium]
MVMTALPSALPTRATQFVEPETYIRLITSRNTLERFDDKEHGLLGLFDRETQARFVVEEHKVLRLWEFTCP